MRQSEIPKLIAALATVITGLTLSAEASGSWMKFCDDATAGVFASPEQELPSKERRESFSLLNGARPPIIRQVADDYSPAAGTPSMEYVICDSCAVIEELELAATHVPVRVVLNTPLSGGRESVLNEIKQRGFSRAKKTRVTKRNKNQKQKGEYECVY